MRRILLLNTDLEVGGTPTVVRELAVRLNRGGGAVVDVACLKGPGPIGAQLHAAGVRVHAFNATSPVELPGVAGDLARLVRARGHDTVLSFLVHANTVAALASRELPGARLLQSIQTVQPRPAWHWWAQRWAARHAERVVVPSTAIVEFASRRSAIPRERFDVIPNAVDPDEFPRATVFAGPRVRVGYLGRLDPAKGPADLLDLPVALPAVDLHYFGDGPARGAIERTVRDRRLGGRVTLHGVTPRPQDALARIDVLALPSVVEGFGLVLIEAMASGVPVVARAAGGVPDVVTDGHDGMLLDAREGFAPAVKRLRDDATLRGGVIANGLRTVRDRFAWDAVLPRYRRLLDG